jgi:hypothetical protein
MRGWSQAHHTRQGSSPTHEAPEARP